MKKKDKIEGNAIVLRGIMLDIGKRPGTFSTANTFIPSCASQFRHVLLIFHPTMN